MNRQQRRDVWLISIFRTISAVGDEVAMFAFGLYFVHTGQKWMLGLLGIATLVPMIAMSPFAGMLVDRYPIRRMLGLVGVAQALVVGALIFVRNPALVLVCVGLLSCGVGITQPGYGALVGSIVPPDEMNRIQGRLSSINAVTWMLGPPIAGFLYSTIDLRGSLFVDAVSFVIVGMVTMLLHHDRVPETGTTKQKGAVLEGVKVIFGDRLLRPAVIQTMLFIFVINMIGIVEVVLITHDMGASAQTYGFVMASFGVGNLLGALVTGRLPGDDLRLVRRLLIGCFVIGLGEAIIGWLPTVTFVFLFMFGAGIGNGMANVSAGTLLMSRIPEEVRGRALAASNASFNSASVLSMAVGAVVVSLISARAIFQISGLSACVVALVLGPVAMSQAKKSAHGDVRNLSQPPAAGE